MEIKMTIALAMLLINFISASVIAFSGSECDSDSLSTSYYKPHPICCELFFQCSSNSTYVLHSCPPDLHFNPILNVCDYPDLAGCLNYDGSTSIPSTSEVTTLPTEDTTMDVTTDITTELTKDLITDDSTSDLTTDSTSDFATDSSSDLATDSTNDIATDSTNDLATDNTSDSTSNLATDITTNTSPSDECSNGEYLPHEEYCEAFYRCIVGTFFLIYCPSGMKFNITTKGCEQQERNCIEDERSTIPEDITTTITPEVSSEFTIEVTSQVPTQPTTEVSTETCANNEFQSDSSDCEAFYRCFNGQFYLLKCPTGMHFNKNTRQCETPEIAGCDVVELTTETTNDLTTDSMSDIATDSTFDLVSDLTTDSTSDFATDNTNDLTTDIETNTFPSDECSNGEYLPHEEDCEAFYRCIVGTFFLIYCPSGMQFNMTIKGCELQGRDCIDEEQKIVM